MAPGDDAPKVRVTEENLVALPALAPYFALGLLALAATPVLLWLAAEPLQEGFYRHPRVLAALHGAALGWGSGIALGALQQMTAVVGATTLHSPRLAAVAFFPFSVGVVCLISGFYTFSPPALAVGAVGVPLGAALVVYNVARTVRTARPTRRWQIIAPFVRSALLYVSVAFAAGGALALNLTRGWLGGLWNDVFPLHIGTAVGGWFFMLVVGISYHLLTFFGLTDKDADFRLVGPVRWLLHGGLLAGVVAPFIGLPGLGTGATAAFVAAAGMFLWESRGLYVRPARAVGAVVHWYVRIAHGYLAVIAGGLLVGLGASTLDASRAAVGGGSLFAPRHYVALGLLLGGGWLTNTILGYLHRILAFFVWHNKYWGRGREPGVPAFRDMVHPGAAAAGFILFNGGVLGAVVALYAGGGMPWAFGLWGVGALVVAGNLAWTMVR